MDRGGEGKTKYEKELVDIPGEVSACLLAGPDHGTAIGLPDPSLAAFLLLSSSAAGLGVSDHSGNIKQSFRYLSNQGDVN